ncbi:hypothetical protein H2201_000092 [Coniosporium apollinis]|uniref:RING-type domain-containing protein n=1 Tax=Coniosporium apollinis TaxID=61459 RepID=A0ABQ9P6M2_9PEZI|nr:hypothetical protein H2201_000092 [Coniosporium apollinis]
MPWSSFSSPAPRSATPPAAVLEQVALREPEDEEPDLRHLNDSLQILAAIFPDIQPGVFRELLSNFSEESRVQIVTESLLKHGAKLVRGRYRQPQEREVPSFYRYRAASTVNSRGMPLAVEDRFRTESYQAAVKSALYEEFKGLSRSTIRAVLAEYNYSYTQARPTLLELASKSWRFSFTNLIKRRKAPSSTSHPLVTWSAPDPRLNIPARPVLTYTENAELNKELYDTLIAPVLARMKEEQIMKDRALAEQLNEAQAEEAGDMYDCGCCFTPCTFEQLSACDDGVHYICFRCVRHSINEALYGQGWARNINTERGTLRCIALETNGAKECNGCLPLSSIQRALATEPKGEETWHKLHERSTTSNLVQSGLPILKCPFCAYAEVDEIYLSTQHLSWRIKNRGLLVLLSAMLVHLLSIPTFRRAFRFLVLFTFLFITLNYLLKANIQIFAPLIESRKRLARKRLGLRFTCLSPFCGRRSCISCHKEWHDIHICHESERQALRTAIERAQAEAIKRTCPNCNLSFVKASGCNKLTCVCGYQMCYVCRQEVGKEGYQHFCQHFRPDPGKACQECDRCDLYKMEDEEMVVRRAGQRAEREWWENQVKEGSFPWEQGRKGVSKEQRDVGMRILSRFKIWERAVWEGLLDQVVDTLVVA